MTPVLTSEQRRAAQRQAFLALQGLADCPLQALPADASARRYFRLAGRGLLLMDCPPACEPLEPYLAVAARLREQGLSAPRVQAHDQTLGLALVEDFGEQTYTRLLRAGAEPRPLYELAVDALVHLHRRGAAAGSGLPPYDATRLAEECALFIDWYAPLLIGEARAEALRTDYLACLAGLCAKVADRRETLVLRDFHVDNLMRLDARAGVAACGLLDFQDALHGACAYDLMSLLEDARRDLPESLRVAMLSRYLQQRGGLDVGAFMHDYQTLAAQRHAKVLGIFVRLARRDGKTAYLQHLPRTLGLFRRAVDLPALQPLREFLDSHLPGWRQPLPDNALAALGAQPA